VDDGPGFWSHVQVVYVNRICRVAKLFEDCLESALEAQAFSGREIGAGCPVRSTSTKCPTRKSRTSSTPRNPSLLPRGIGVAKLGGHGAHGSQQGVLGESGIMPQTNPQSSRLNASPRAGDSAEGARPVPTHLPVTGRWCRYQVRDSIIRHGSIRRQ
jgi:hypothetical protein